MADDPERYLANWPTDRLQRYRAALDLDRTAKAAAPQTVAFADTRITLIDQILDARGEPHTRPEDDESE